MAMARSMYLCAALLLAATSAIAEPNTFAAYTTNLPTNGENKTATMKLVVHNLADRRISFNLAELGENASAVVAEKNQWTSIGPFNVSNTLNPILHLNVTVDDVTKAMEVDLREQFQYDLEGSKFLVLVAIENALQKVLKIKLGSQCPLTFNLS